MLYTNICNPSLLWLFTLLPGRLSMLLPSNSAAILRNDRIRRIYTFLKSTLGWILKRLAINHVWATFIACWHRIFAPLDKNGKALLNNPPRILPRPRALFACVHRRRRVPILRFASYNSLRMCSAGIATKLFPHYDKKYGFRLRQKCSATTTLPNSNGTGRPVSTLKLFPRDWNVLRCRIQFMNQISKISGGIDYA